MRNILPNSNASANTTDENITPSTTLTSSRSNSNSESVRTPRPKKRKIISRRSWTLWTWNQFREGESKHPCNYCFKIILVYGLSTSELIRHLRVDHSIYEHTNTGRVVDYNFEDAYSGDEYDSDSDAENENAQPSKISALIIYFFYLNILNLFK